jgi:VIT1/CCC1 family predicted Fe2+/Mn2+ transporter
MAKTRSAQKSRLNKRNIIRWTARLLSAGMIILMLMFIFGEGLPDFEKLSLREIIMMSAFFIMLAGMITAWWKEGAGGIMIFGGMVVFWTVNLVTTNQFWLHWIFLLFPLIGGLFIYSWRASRAR